MQRQIYIIFLITLLNCARGWASPLPIDDYLDQVSKSNPDIHAALVAQNAAKTQVQDSNIVFLPQLEVTAQSSDSQQATFMGAFYGTENQTQSYLIGIKEMTNFGLSGEVTYQANHYNIQGVSTGILQFPDYYYTQPGVKLTQELWKNGFGAQDRADEQAKRFSAEGTYYQNLAKYKASLIEAQNTYLKLFYLRKTTAALRESLELAAQLRVWAKSRAQSELGDKSDFLQTEAAYELRQLELVRNENDLKNTARSFNSLRGVDSDDVADELLAVNKTMPEVQMATLMRIDTEASAKMLEAAKAKSKSNEELAKPTLELFASYAYSYVGLNWQVAEEFGYHPILTYGINFVTPIAFSKAERVANSFVKEVEAAEYSLRRQKQVESRDLQILLSQIQNSGERLKLSEKLEASQKSKLDTERARHRHGRTSLFQVLQFEQDFVSAQLSRISTELEYHTNLNQLDLYESDSK